MAKKTAKKATAKQAEPKAKSFAQQAKPIVKKHSLTEEAWTKEGTFHKSNGKLIRNRRYVERTLRLVLDQLRTSYEGKAPLQSADNFGALMTLVAEAAPWSTDGASRVLGDRPTELAKAALDLLSPEAWSGGKLVRVPLDFDTLDGGVTVHDLAVNLKTLAEEIADIHNNLEPYEEDSDGDAVDYDSIARWKEESGEWSSELAYLDSVFALSSFADLVHEVEVLAEHAELLSETLGPDTPIESLEAIARLVPKENYLV